MEGLKEYLIPYIISNVIFAASIFGAANKPFYTRIFFVLLFIWASYTNITTAAFTPEVYLEYGKLTFIPFYKEFIYGFFASHIQAFVITIALCQLFIAIGLMLNTRWVKAACAGGILFGLAIAPFGVGSGFPSTVFMAIALYTLLKYRFDYIWKWKQNSMLQHR